MTLYLLPNVLGPVKDHRLFLPPSVAEAVSRIDGLIAESEGGGRSYLKRFKTKKKPHEMPIALMTSKKQEIAFLLEPLLKGETWGVVSDCGLPCLADPGALLVHRARVLNIPVEVFVGPSAITHALVLSGLGGQAFTFHGYPPKEPQARAFALRTWDKVQGMTHIFIEAPYRNQHTLRSCIEELHAATCLCVATELTLPGQKVMTQSISTWRSCALPDLAKRPTIFLFTHLTQKNLNGERK
jgi:16S rRNA (cytidine1402-2'-O)-methyltransferase